MFKGEKSCTTASSQIAIMKDAGWSTSKPKVKEVKETKKTEKKAAKTKLNKSKKVTNRLVTGAK